MGKKHDQILAYIETLPVGERISVRSIAKNLHVSEGTAYRAIKDAESIGYVSTIERVGTVRIERKLKENFERLTYREVVKIIDGEIIGGAAGLDKPLNKFVIGAMKEKAILRYISPDALMIVGNRDEVQQLALSYGAAVLITGGFEASEAIIQLANELSLPLLGTSYDTFTVATMINRALRDQLITKEILTIQDIYTPIEKTNYLDVQTNISDFLALSEETHHTRFPVVNNHLRLMGIVTAKDIIGRNETVSIERVITKSPTCAKLQMSVASVAHLMIWDGLEVMPVIDDNFILKGIVSRQDIMKAMSIAQRQPQMAETIADQIATDVTYIQNSPYTQGEIPVFSFMITPQMTNGMGTISLGVLSEILTNTAERSVLAVYRKGIVIEQMDVHFLKMIQLGSEITIVPRILDIGRRSSKIDMEVYLENIIVTKAIITCQLIEQTI